MGDAETLFPDLADSAEQVAAAARPFRQAATMARSLTKSFTVLSGTSWANWKGIAGLRLRDELSTNAPAAFTHIGKCADDTADVLDQYRVILLEAERQIADLRMRFLTDIAPVIGPMPDSKTLVLIEPGTPYADAWDKLTGLRNEYSGLTFAMFPRTLAIRGLLDVVAAKVKQPPASDKWSQLLVTSPLTELPIASPTVPPTPGLLFVDPDAVRALQTRLLALGATGVSVTGMLDGNTNAAVQAFQKAHGLPVGPVDDRTWKALWASPS